MNSEQVEFKKINVIYKSEAPDGGWGYVLVLSFALMLIVTVGQLPIFGIVYGRHLATLGDEASATATISCIFNTLTNLMGLVANHLMKKHSCRFVGILGSIFFVTGNFLSIFANTVAMMVITFGILQGIGFGLMLAATFASMNQYFTKKKNFVMGIGQTLNATAVMGLPYFARILMDEFGYRGTVALLAALSLHAFLAMLTLQPVEMHMVKIPVSAIEMTSLSKEQKLEDKNIYENEKMIVNEDDKKKNTCLKQFCTSIFNFLEVSQLKDPSYVNIAIGLSLSFSSDILFISLLPMYLYHMGFNNEETAYLMTAFLVSDLVGRLSFSLISAVFKLKTRIVFLCGSALSATVRIVFVLFTKDWHMMTTLVIALGVFRCLIIVTYPLVLAEYSPTKYPAALGLYLSIQGIIFLVSGQFLSLVAINTTGDMWTQLILMSQLLLCVLPWVMEMAYKKIKK